MAVVPEQTKSVKSGIGGLGSLGLSTPDFTSLMDESLFRPFRFDGNASMEEAMEVSGNKGGAIGGLVGSAFGPVGGAIGGLFGKMIGRARAERKMRPIVNEREAKKDNFISMNARIAGQRELDANRAGTQSYLDSKLRSNL